MPGLPPPQRNTASMKNNSTAVTNNSSVSSNSDTLSDTQASELLSISPSFDSENTERPTTAGNASNNNKNTTEHLYERISTKHVEQNSEKSMLATNIINKLKNKRASVSDRASRIYGAMMMHAPKLGLEAVEILVALSIAAFLSDCGFSVNHMALCTPSATMLKTMMVEEAVDSLVIEKIIMKVSPLTIMVDKGEGESKRDRASFVKLCTCYDDKRSKINVTSIGIQGAGNSSLEGAAGVDLALKFFDDDDHKQQVDHGGSDGGGGATRQHFGTKLNEKVRVKNIYEYLATTCALHGLNLSLSSLPLLILVTLCFSGATSCKLFTLHIICHSSSEQMSGLACGKKYNKKV